MITQIPTSGELFGFVDQAASTFDRVKKIVEGKPDKSEVKVSTDDTGEVVTAEARDDKKPEAEKVAVGKVEMDRKTLFIVAGAFAAGALIIYLANAKPSRPQVRRGRRKAA